jgi:hypothetical protein
LNKEFGDGSNIEAQTSKVTDGTSARTKTPTFVSIRGCGGFGFS